MPKVSVIVTVKNEEGSIGALISSLLGQSRRPEEIVIVDGGSTDDTVKVIEGWIKRDAPIKLIVAPGANISQGRNLAIRSATNEIIAATDAGVKLPPDWLSELLAGFKFDGSDDPRGNAGIADVVSGFFISDPSTTFEVAMGATVLPRLDEIDGQRFLPSSRSVAFRKDSWQSIGGYPEWLDYGEDLVFDLDLRAAGFRFAFAPRAIAYFRPRQSLRAFFKQYYLYARGDGKAGLWPRRHAIRYTTYVLAPIALALGFWYKVFWLLTAIGCLAYLQRPYRRLWSSLADLGRVEQFEAILWVPIIRLVGDIAKMIGYPVGLWWRRKNSGRRA